MRGPATPPQNLRFPGGVTIGRAGRANRTAAGPRRSEIRDTFPIALLAGFDGETVEACLRQLGPELHLLVAGSEEEALRLLGGQPIAVLALGAALAGERARRLLETAEEFPGAAERVEPGARRAAPSRPCSRS